MDNLERLRSIVLFLWRLSGLARNEEAEARGISAIVAAVLGRERAHVHVKFEEPLAGRIAFGGEFNGK